jgi:deoxyadenosine/deoxycytidine kinase
MTLKNGDGKSLLELFYEDKKRWSYTFQNAAILTRLKAITAAMRAATKPVLVTERSVLTDRFVFAEMLRDKGDLDELEWQLYMSWFDAFASQLPIRAIIYVTTGVATSHARIAQRGRAGEAAIPQAYLADLQAQHEKWVAGTELPVLRLSTEPGEDIAASVGRVREFVAGLLSGAGGGGGAGAVAAPAAAKDAAHGDACGSTPSGSSPVKMPAARG